MNNQKRDTDLDSWLKELDAGRHYRETPAFVVPAVRQKMFKAVEVMRNRPDFLPGDPPDVDLSHEMKPRIPEDKFEDLVQITHNRFVKSIANGNSLRGLEEALPNRLDALANEIDEIDERIDSLEELEGRCEELVGHFETIDEAVKADALSEGVEQLYTLPEGAELQYRLPRDLGPSQLPDSNPEFVPLYDVTDLLRGEGETTICRGDRSPSRIGECARAAIENVRRENLLPKRRAKAVGQLRLRILEYVRSHYQVTGLPPEKISGEKVEEEITEAREKNQEGGKGGRPGHVARGRKAEERIPILDKLLSDLQNWRLEDGQPVKPNYPLIFEKAEEEDPELFYLKEASLRDYIKRHFDLGQKRHEMKKKLIGLHRTNLPDKPCPRQTPGLSGIGRDT